MTSPILVFGWGNPSRGDDALGPCFVERIAALRLPGVECLTDFQLQVEHVLDLLYRRKVLFADASVSLKTAFEVSRLLPHGEINFTTHALSPAALLKLFHELYPLAAAPACYQLAIRGERFELGETLTRAAASHLEAALAWAKSWLAQSTRFVTK